MPATLLERALLASRLPQSARGAQGAHADRHRQRAARRCGAAAVTIVSMTREQSVPTVSSADGRAVGRACRARRDARRARNAGRRGSGDAAGRRRDVRRARRDRAQHRAARPAPARLPGDGARSSGVEGHVQLEFDVTAAGVVENVSVVESSDAQFEDAAVEARRAMALLAAHRGRQARGAREGIHTVDPVRSRAATNRRRTRASKREAERGATRISPRSRRGSRSRSTGSPPTICAAPSCSSTRCRRSTARATAELWNFYGYLYTVQGNYDRAIDAYETAVSAFARNGTPRRGAVCAARESLLRAPSIRHGAEDAAAAEPPGRQSRSMSPEADALAQKLNALGVTEETLQ